jgi:hypothetical protein
MNLHRLRTLTVALLVVAAGALVAPVSKPIVQDHGRALNSANAAAGPALADGPREASPLPMPASDAPQYAAGDRSSFVARELVLTPEQMRLIADQFRGERGKAVTATTVGSGEPSANFSIGNVLPVAAPMQAFPVGLTTQMPALNELKYVRLLTRILIVSPAERIILAEVPL